MIFTKVFKLKNDVFWQVSLMIYLIQFLYVSKFKIELCMA